MEKIYIYIFVVNLDKIYITMIQVSETAKRKSSIWWKKMALMPHDYVRVGVKAVDVHYLMIWSSIKPKEKMKIFVDNNITIAVEKIFLYLAGTILEFQAE
jgi:hypothetical protein